MHAGQFTAAYRAQSGAGRGHQWEFPPVSTRRTDFWPPSYESCLVYRPDEYVPTFRYSRLTISWAP